MNYYTDYQKFLKHKKINPKLISKYNQLSSQYLDDSLFINNDVSNRLLKERIIVLSGDIDIHNCELIKANLLYLESLDNEKDIQMYINSPGGSVYDGLGLLDLMEYIKPDISTINTGLAASMAAIILCSGKKGKRKSMKRSRVMIHQPLSFGGWVQQASDMEIEAKEINHLKKELYEIISNNTGQSYDKVSKDSDRDYWMSSHDAKKYGMIDEILIKRK